MNFKLYALAAVAAMAPVAAHAGPVTFEDASGIANAGQSIASGGYTFTLSQNGSFEAIVGGGGLPVSNGTNALFLANFGSITMTLTGGGAFSLSSLDLGGSFGPDRWAGGVNVIGNLSGGGQITTLLNLAGTPSGFSTHNLVGYSSVTSIVFNPLQNANGGSNNYEFQLDNLNVNAVTGVPEAATWAMMVIGFGAIGGALRRRQTVATRVRFA